MYRLTKDNICRQDIAGFYSFKEGDIADFRRLGYFLQIAELGSLTRTAERLGIAQPSLSRQMRLLEEELGVSLFTRGYRGMQLTEAGEALRQRISGPLRQVGHALLEIRSLPSDTQGTVIFGMPASVAGLLGPALLAQVATQTPGISLLIVEATSAQLLAMMKRGELDIAVLYGPTPVGINAARMLDDELVLVSAAGAAPGQYVDFRTIGDLNLVLPSESHGLRIAIEGICAKKRMRLQVALQIDSLQLIQKVIMSNRLHSILPYSCLTAQLDAGLLQATPIRDPSPARQLFLTMQSEAESPRAVLQVEQLARQRAASLVACGAWPKAEVFGVGDA